MLIYQWLIWFWHLTSDFGRKMAKNEGVLPPIVDEAAMEAPDGQAPAPNHDDEAVMNGAPGLFFRVFLVSDGRGGVW